MEDKSCAKCVNYNHGDGDNSCLKCHRFDFILRRSQSIKLGPSPPAIIIESIPNPERLINIFQVISTLETREASIIMLKYLANRSTREIAEFHQLSHVRVAKILRKALRKVKGMVKGRGRNDPAP